MNYDVIDVSAIEHLKLKVTFRDRTQGTVIFYETFLTGVFEPLKKPDFFSQVNCHHGFVAWADDIDLAPDAMYEAIKTNGKWILQE